MTYHSYMMHSWFIGKRGQLRNQSAQVQIQYVSHYSKQKLCYFNLSKDHFERISHWANGIELQSLCSVRFRTSLVRNCLNYPETSELKGCNGIMAIDLAS